VEWNHTIQDNRGGSILTLWNSSVFSLDNCVIGKGFICIQGKWSRHEQEVIILNVYRPNTFSQKKEP